MYNRARSSLNFLSFCSILPRSPPGQKSRIRNSFDLVQKAQLRFTMKGCLVYESTSLSVFAYRVKFYPIILYLLSTFMAQVLFVLFSLTRQTSPNEPLPSILIGRKQWGPTLSSSIEALIGVVIVLVNVYQEGFISSEVTVIVFCFDDCYWNCCC